MSDQWVTHTQLSRIAENTKAIKVFCRWALGIAVIAIIQSAAMVYIIYRVFLRR